MPRTTERSPSAAPALSRLLVAECAPASDHDPAGRQPSRGSFRAPPTGPGRHRADRVRSAGSPLRRRPWRLPGRWSGRPRAAQHRMGSGRCNRRPVSVRSRMKKSPKNHQTGTTTMAIPSKSGETHTGAPLPPNRPKAVATNAMTPAGSAADRAESTRPPLAAKISHKKYCQKARALPGPHLGPEPPPPAQHRHGHGRPRSSRPSRH